MKFYSFVVVPDWNDTAFYLDGFSLQEKKPKTAYRG